MTGDLELSILGPAFLAGLLVLSTHVPLGQEVLRRGIIFIDIAIAQLAGTGMIAMQVFHPQPDWWQLQVAGLGTALLGAALLTWTESRWPRLQEAIIGTMFVTMASTTILLLANDPHGGEELQSLLAGQILWVTTDMLWAAGGAYALVLLAWFALDLRWRRKAFYLLFTIAVTTSVQQVGVYLVFASLIMPALATYRLHGTPKLFTGYLAGGCGYGIGLLAAAQLDLPAGPAVIVALLSCTAVTLLATARTAQPLDSVAT